MRLQYGVFLRLPGTLTQSRRMLLRLPKTEEELYRPSKKEISFTADVSDYSVTAFNIMSKHFPRAWGFLWSVEENSLSTAIMGLPEHERESAYRQLARRECGWLRERVGREESCNVSDGLLTVGGESGKRVISEAYRCVGLPPYVSFKCDLAFLNLKNKVPMEWIVRDAPAAFNIHPAPPERPGAGVYAPSILAGEKEYGVTVHFMTHRVDDGPIIKVKRFPIPEGATKTSLYTLTGEHCLEMFEELMLCMKFTEPLTDISTRCHHIWGPVEVTRRMMRKMLKQAEGKYGEKGHPALL